MKPLTHFRADFFLRGRFYTFTLLHFGCQKHTCICTFARLHFCTFNALLHVCPRALKSKVQKCKTCKNLINTMVFSHFHFCTLLRLHSCTFAICTFALLTPICLHRQISVKSAKVQKCKRANAGRLFRGSSRRLKNCFRNFAS